jgi:3-dehydroquinate dehydratase/shikimate dehydrogenase
MRERVEFWQSVLPRFGGVNCTIDREFDLDIRFETDPKRTIVSSHNFNGPDWDLPPSSDLASTLKVAITVEDAADAIYVWRLLDPGIGRGVIPIAMGEAGKWTRILGLAHGAPMTYASIDRGGETAPGQISARDLRDVFRVKELNLQTDVYGVIAGDTSYSLSPYMHNAAFKHTGINSVFIPIQVANLDSFMRRMVKPARREVELNFKGFSVTNPHKQAIMKHLDSIDETAQEIGAVNTVKIQGGRLHGYNTDAPGFIDPLRKVFGALADSRVAVVGAGGAARACVYALKQEGADVTVLARDAARASAFAEEFGVKSAALASDGGLNTEILVNASPLGTRGSSEGEAVATTDELDGVKLVYDLVYNPEETELLRRAKIAGAKTLGGMEMLVAQGAQQFVIWTGVDAPINEMKAALNRRLKETYAS